MLRFLHDPWIERHSEVESIRNGIGLQEASTNEHEHETEALTVSAPPMVELFTNGIGMAAESMRSYLDTMLL